ncbi:MAG TPA: UTP--glucose-1-phosphate uridylyltransferase GalU [Burkholderiales bacterium]|nr:UTP--glucose-1-phosphate uridylyltransferase GalU [Burkholderiales bacterium]
MTPPIKKAILPVAGWGTRFLPATKAAAKEMLPIVDKPLVQFAVEEAVAAGITDIIFVTSRAKRVIEDHFDPGDELDQLLQVSGKHHLLASLRPLFPPQVRYAYVRQPQALGLGHAVLCAQALVGDEPFAVILPDELMDAQPCVLAQMLEHYGTRGSSIVAVEHVARQETDKYGIVALPRNAGRISPISGIVEKPSPSEAPSRMAVVGRYLLTPRIFDCLAELAPGKHGEIQLTDAIAALSKREPVLAYPFAGRRFDCGSKLGYLAATIHYGLKHPEVGESFARLIIAAREDLVGSEAALADEPASALDPGLARVQSATVISAVSEDVSATPHMTSAR